jgi:DNA-directed RNA polymerase subunit RPC12/RpoP
MTTRAGASADFRFKAVFAAALACGAVLAFFNPPAGITLMAVSGGLGALVYWHADAHAYRCEDCSAEFTITAWEDLTTPHHPNSKYLRCPSCGQRNWAEIIDRNARHSGSSK